MTRDRMRFKTSNIKEAKHSELVSCVGWASPDDVISIGDDHQILRWNLVSAETVKVEKKYFWRIEIFSLLGCGPAAGVLPHGLALPPAQQRGRDRGRGWEAE